MVTRIKSSQITDGTILNADVNASAAVVATKISGSQRQVRQRMPQTRLTLALVFYQLLD